MVRLLTAAAVAALIASPVLAQDVSGSGATRDQSQVQQQQDTLGSPAPPGTEESLQQAPQAGQIPADCAPNDPRPECQTAQLPSTPEQQPSDEMGSGVPDETRQAPEQPSPAPSTGD